MIGLVLQQISFIKLSNQIKKDFQSLFFNFTLKFRNEKMYRIF